MFHLSGRKHRGGKRVGEGRGSDWGQEGRPKFPYLPPMRRRQPRSVKYQHGLERAVLSILSQEDREVLNHGGGNTSSHSA